MTMKTNLLALTAALALAVPAAAQSDADFAARLNIDQLKNMPVFLPATHETGPNDPLLLAQKPLIDLIKKVQPSVVFLVMTMPNEEKPDKPGHATCTGFFTDSM